MNAKFQPGDVVQRHGNDRKTVTFCGEMWFIGVDSDGNERIGPTAGHDLVPPPLPEPYIGYTHGGSDPDGVPTVYPLSIFHGSDTFYDSDLYEVEVRYIRKVDTRRPF